MNRNRKITVQWCDKLPQNGQNYLVIDEVCLNRLQLGKKKISLIFLSSHIFVFKMGYNRPDLSQELVDFTLLAS